MNSKFQLFLDTVEPELFRKATSDLGNAFYHKTSDETVEIVYFSGSRVARYNGPVTDDIVKFLKVCGWEVDCIELDELSGTVRIVQKSGVKNLE